VTPEVIPTLVYDLDAANYSAVPTNGSVISGYTLSVANAGSSISWQPDYGGLFRKSNSTGTDYIAGGPNYVTSQSYSVFMVYKVSVTSLGRLLNTQSEATKDWLMGAYSNGLSKINVFYPNFTVNLTGVAGDTVWHMDWVTWDTNTSTGKIYTALPTSVAPSSALYTATNAGGGGFNQLRLFSRAAGSEVQTGDIAFVKVYNGVLGISTIQSLFAQYSSRFIDQTPTPTITPTITKTPTQTLTQTPTLTKHQHRQ